MKLKKLAKSISKNTGIDEKIVYEKLTKINKETLRRLEQDVKFENNKK